jgi:hypothetical protein
MQITRTSLWSGMTRTLALDITPEQVALWQGGMVIQQAMPQLSASDREFLLSGLIQSEWEEMSTEDDDEQ